MFANSWSQNWIRLSSSGRLVILILKVARIDCSDPSSYPKLMLEGVYVYSLSNMRRCVRKFMVSEWDKAEFIWASGHADASDSSDWLLRSVCVSQIDV